MTPHVINYLRVMRGMRPLQHFAGGGVAQPYPQNSWLGQGGIMPPPPIGPINGFGGGGYNIDPYNTFPIGNKGGGGFGNPWAGTSGGFMTPNTPNLGGGPGPTYVGGGGQSAFNPPPPIGPINDFVPGPTMPPLIQPFPTDFGGGNPNPITPGLLGPPIPSGFPAGSLPPANPNVSGTRQDLINSIAGQDPNNNPANLAPGTQPWLMQQKFGKGPAPQGLAKGGVVKKKDKRKMKLVPGKYQELEPYDPEHLDPNSLRGWASNAGAGNT